MYRPAIALLGLLAPAALGGPVRVDITWTAEFDEATYADLADHTFEGSISFVIDGSRLDPADPVEVIRPDGWDAVTLPDDIKPPPSKDPAVWMRFEFGVFTEFRAGFGELGFIDGPIRDFNLYLRGAPDIRDGLGFATYAYSYTGDEVIASTAQVGASATFTPIPAPPASLALAGVALAARRRR